MKATDLLKQQHDEVKVLFDRLESTDSDTKKQEIFEKIAANLVAHDAIEREIFYPACEEAMGMTDLLGEALVEHGVVEFSLYLADQAKQDEDFDFKCKVLREMLEHHIDEEEQEFFPKAEKAIGKDEISELSTKMKQRFKSALASDFRVALHGNLKQVLAGATKTKSVPPKAKPPVVRTTVTKASNKGHLAAKGKNARRTNLHHQRHA